MAHGNRQDELEIGPISDLELGWLAGLWEGEGHFGYDRTQLAHLRMTDLDTIQKMKQLIECVLKLPKPITLLYQYSGRKNEQETFGIQTYGATARAIMRLLLPLMGNRRRAQIWRSLNGYRPKLIKLPEDFLRKLLKK
jgi:hypothetical protein